MQTLDFEEYWADLRRTLGKQESILPALGVVSLPAIQAWVQDPNPDRPSFVVISGAERDHVYRSVEAEDQMFSALGIVHDLIGPSSQAWKSEGILTHLTRRMRSLEIPPEYRDKQSFMIPRPERSVREWDLLWGLVACSYLVVQEPLDALVDRRFSLLAEAHKAILEARFEVLETKSWPEIATALSAIGQWVEGTSPSALLEKECDFLLRAGVSHSVGGVERLEVLHFLLALAKQNGILGGVLLALDGIEDLDEVGSEELNLLLDVTERWSKLGSPLGILLGWRGSKQDIKALKALNPRLAARVTNSVALLKTVED